jgi:3-deoxy-manno-octulosonate cytidylyltransferase (CMP-KDO synthetase)
MKTEIDAIIPARWASTRFPGKPLHPLAGKPLLQHVWERCCAAREIARVIVATDDMRIATAAFDFGAEVAMTSPRHRSGTDRVAEVAAKLSVSHIINVQGDEPLIDPALINRLAKTLRENPAIEMITAANPIAGAEQAASPHAVKVVLDRASNALYFSRSPIPFFRESDSAAYHRHQGIYGYSKKFLLQFVKWKPTPLEKAESLEQLRALENGAKIRVLVTKSVSLGVDTPEDAETVSELLGKSP